jgi:hypothetical protein
MPLFDRELTQITSIPDLQTKKPVLAGFFA